jgi:hypothetical protein
VNPKWKKSPPELVARFQSLVPGAPAEQRQMFGYPAAFAGGNMFASLFEDDVVLRLSDGDRARFMQLSGARTFEPMPGRPMREYVVAPPSLREDDAALGEWIARAFAYGQTLPPKAGKKPAAKAKPTRKPPSKAKQKKK